ncbi:MAG: glycosyltransferase [Candidatus Anstonellales archaeon]
MTIDKEQYFKETVKLLQKKIQSLNKHIEDLERENRLLSEEKEKQLSEINELRGSIEDLERENRLLSGEKEKQLSEINELRKVFEVLKREKDEINSRLTLVYNTKTWKLNRLYAMLIGDRWLGRKINGVLDSLFYYLSSFRIYSKQFGTKQAIKRSFYVIKEKFLDRLWNLRKKELSHEVISDSLNISSGKVNLRLVNIITPTFFNFEGKDMYCGGAERYLIELYRLIKNFGYEVRVYQNSTSNWISFYDGIKVEGINSDGNSLILNHKFHREKEKGILTIYFAFYLAYPLADENSIGISHGIFWDHSCHDPVEKNKIMASIKNCRKIISVDTNTINWIRAEMYNESYKILYIPNFVDLNEFYPIEKLKDRIVVLYPRRLYYARGFYLVINLIPYFLEKYSNIEFHFVGKADPKEEKLIKDIQNKFSRRVKWFYLPPDKMKKAYDDADIVLIPTIHSEGTSLSCLEAMACGKAIIATNVGGLPNLIIDGYNGILINPNERELQEKLQLLVENDDLRKELGINARKTSQVFDIERWKDRWINVLKDFLPEIKDGTYKGSLVRNKCFDEGCLTFYHPRTPGITWGKMKQRPHHIFRALSKANQCCIFVSDSEDERILPAEKIEVLSSKDKVYIDKDKTILYIYYPYHYELLEDIKDFKVIYDVLDNPVIHNDKKALHYHELFLDMACLVMTSSKPLWEKIKPMRKDILLVPNGVFIEDFRTENKNIPSDIPKDGRPLIGYYGAIADWIDYDLLVYSATKRPDYNFILIGPVSSKKFDKLRPFKNVFYLGTKAYEELPDYLYFFDVATIPFKINEITLSTSPVKLFEYASQGKPIVTTDLYEVRSYDGILISHSFEEYIENIDKALLLKNDQIYVEKIKKIAEENTWKLRAEKIMNAINKLLPNLSIK